MEFKSLEDRANEKYCDIVDFGTKLDVDVPSWSKKLLWPLETVGITLKIKTRYASRFWDKPRYRRSQIQVVWMQITQRARSCRLTLRAVITSSFLSHA